MYLFEFCHLSTMFTFLQWPSQLLTWFHVYFRVLNLLWQKRATLKAFVREPHFYENWKHILLKCRFLVSHPFTENSASEFEARVLSKWSRPWQSPLPRALSSEQLLSTQWGSSLWSISKIGLCCFAVLRKYVLYSFIVCPSKSFFFF